MHIVKNYLTLPFLLNLLHGAHNIPLRRKTSGRSKKTQYGTVLVRMFVHDPFL